MLRPHGPDGRIALQAGLYEEEGASRSGADDAGRGAAEDVDGEVLGVFVGQEEARHALAHGLVEPQAAAVEQDLVDVGGSQSAVDAADAFVLDDDADAVDRAAVVLGLGALCLQLALELLADLEDFGWVGDGDGAARRQSACGETAGDKRVLVVKLS